MPELQSVISDLWVSDEGTYGFNQVLLVSTKRWTLEDFDELEQASDSERMEKVIEISQKREGDYAYA